MKKNILFSLLLFATLTMSMAKAATTTILVYGDSLSANYGIPIEAGWVSLLTQRIKSEYTDYQIINTSISGETTLGGHKRIDQTLATHNPNIILVELGANDGLRGTSIQSIYDNLATIIKKSQEKNIQVLLIGMRLPPNYGATYTVKFQSIFTQLAKEYQVSLVPYLFEGFGENPEFFLADRLHPNEKAQLKIVETIWPVLQPMLSKSK